MNPIVGPNTFGHFTSLIQFMLLSF